jgi:putative membrane protein
VAESTTTPAGEQGSDSPAENEPDYRFTLANERTFLAWQRTALGLLAAAVALVQLVPELTIPGARRALGVLLAALAIVTSGMGLLRWQQADRAMRRGLPLPRQPSPGYLALGLLLVGVIALGLVIAKVVIG